MLMLNQCIFLAFLFGVIMIIFSLIIILFLVLRIYHLKKDKPKKAFGSICAKMPLRTLRITTLVN